MTRVLSLLLAVLTSACLVCGTASAEDDAEGCKDHPLFTRMPDQHIWQCRSSPFDMRRFPVGPVDANGKTKTVDVEGSVLFIGYKPNEGAVQPSGLQVMRNFQNAAKKAGATIEGEYPGNCQIEVEQQHMPDVGPCADHSLTMKFPTGGKETWVWLFYDCCAYPGGYRLVSVEREAMKQEVSVNELADKLTKEGFLTLYVSFDTGKATIKPDSGKTLDDAAAALQAASTLQIEVGGHTDNVGTPESNQALSDARAKAVMAALVERGVSAARLTAKGYGPTSPVADNRSEEGRSKNRRVELVKK